MDVLSHSWDSKRIKHLFEERIEKNSNSKNDYLSIVKDVGVIPYSEKGNVGNKTSENPENYKRVYPDDLVINPMNVTIGSVGISNYYGCLSNVYMVLKPKIEFYPQYYGYLFQIKSFQKSLRKISYGIMEIRESINKIEFFGLKIPTPPLSEQQQIVSFLDTKTSLIDSLIGKTQIKIELLKEKRISLINEVVTKGLNPNVKMKESGEEWIGEIPDDWRVVPLRHLGSFQNGISKGSEFFGTGYPFMSYGDVYKNDITPTKLNGKVQLEDSEIDRYTVQRGDVFFTRTSETRDDIGVCSTCLNTIENSGFSGFVIRFRFHNNVHLPEYSRYHFQTYWKKVIIESKMNIVTRSSLSQQVLGDTPVLIPDTDEQQQIVKYLDEQTQLIDNTISIEEKRTKLLKEYRQSLISDVVTGKLKVNTDG